MGASLTSGRPVALRGCEATIWAPLAASEISAENSSIVPGALRVPGGGGVRLHRDDRHALGDIGGDRVVAGEDTLGGDRPLCFRSRRDVDRVGDKSGVELDRKPARDLLALDVGGGQNRGRGRLLGQLLQRLACRVEGLLGADAQRGHLDLVPAITTSSGLLLQLEGLLDGVLVELGQDPSTPTRSTVLSSSKFRSAVTSGTDLTQTRMLFEVTAVTLPVTPRLRNGAANWARSIRADLPVALRSHAATPVNWAAHASAPGRQRQVYDEPVASGRPIGGYEQRPCSRRAASMGAM